MDRLETVAIVGVGLIGGSIGMALRSRGLARRVVGIGRDPERLQEARRLGAVDACETDLARGAAGADVIAVCTPVSRIADDVRAAAAVAGGALVTDAGSTKRHIVQQIEADPLARPTFVGAHPIAGSERKGATHASADLFEGRTCVLTPTDATPADRLDRARSFWALLGARVIEMDPATHDEALALTSHLPHVLASALAATVAPDLLPLAAGAYRDGTRVACSDGALWAGIFLANRDPLLRAIDDFGRRLALFRDAIEAGDEQALVAFWEAAKQTRESYREPGSAPRNGPPTERIAPCST